MTIIPAIDLLGGHVVRLRQGSFDDVDVYDQDPVSMAREFEEAGATRLHVVDLDAARGDKQANRKKIRKIRKAVRCTIELGGGIRSDDDIEELLDLGIDRLVLGTTFARKPSIVEGWSAHYGNVFLAGIDSRDGQVYVSGWEEETKVADIDLAKRAKETGILAIIFTSIDRDGMMQGPNIERTNRIAEASGLPVILSGGVSSRGDLDRVQSEGHANIVAAITGKAIYEGGLDIKEVFSAFPGSTEEETW